VSASIDDVVLQCYRLGKFYGVGPDYFLKKPFSEMAINLERATMLAEKMQLEQSWDLLTNG